MPDVHLYVRDNDDLSNNNHANSSHAETNTSRQNSSQGNADILEHAESSIQIINVSDQDEEQEDMMLYRTVRDSPNQLELLLSTNEGGISMHSDASSGLEQFRSPVPLQLTSSPFSTFSARPTIAQIEYNIPLLLDRQHTEFFEVFDVIDTHIGVLMNTNTRNNNENSNRVNLIIILLIVIIVYLTVIVFQHMNEKLN